MFEFISKNEEESSGKSGDRAPSNQYEVLLKRRIQKWAGKPWIMPEFLKIKKNLFVGGADKISVREDIDLARVNASTNKKVKGVYDLMQTYKVVRIVSNYSDGSNMLGMQLNTNSW